MTNMKQGNLVTLPGLPAFYDYEWYPLPDDVRETPQYKTLYSSEWSFSVLQGSTSKLLYGL